MQTPTNTTHTTQMYMKNLKNRSRSEGRISGEELKNFLATSSGSENNLFIYSWLGCPSYFCFCKIRFPANTLIISMVSIFYSHMPVCVCPRFVTMRHLGVRCLTRSTERTAASLLRLDAFWFFMVNIIPFLRHLSSKC